MYTVKDLKTYLTNIPDDTEVLIEGRDPSGWNWCVDLQDMDYKRDEISLESIVGKDDTKYLILNVGIV
jgi:hypothetical protein